MIRHFKIEGSVILRDGTVVLTGPVDGPGWEHGPLLGVGRQGFAATSTGDIRVEVIGSGGGDRGFVKPGMEMVLVKVLTGNPELLAGATLTFE